MRALIQRVSKACVSVDGETVGKIGAGLLILVCAMRGDDEGEAVQLASKIAKLRIFRDAADKMNRSILDTGGAALVVSQFTLAADTKRGNRPGFSEAASPDEGKHLYEFFAEQLQSHGIPVERGVFGADMAVELTNSGPVTIWMDSADRR
ncbi:D-aminoacyl-tRNA deacylase [Ruegeria sp. 2205SS24-7]|uniref:D-aminoacyl-tRNA deacylase n=1 Tax=Ruegeria discodermiae TaxID=3064389 RepID=UPI00274148CE|nr:D-aminoacyl-tRNA deacylase [Ruegeria sp. 2205SS24-7]MDP5217967.1 D-aminoacyl-tRNA deacylase [Ruegeria sp. 2205SS24-7]